MDRISNPEKFVPLERLQPRRSPEKKNYTEGLSKMMGRISERINKEVKEQYGLSDFLDKDGALDMDGYADGPYSAERVEKDKADVSAMEIDFSDANDARVRAFYGAKTPAEAVEKWKEEKKKNKNGQMEMAVTGLLYKILKDDFLVVRATAHDDYKGGVDNIILNKRTGEAICAFDEVHEGGKGERTDGKIAKIQKVAARGGANVSYGIKLEDGKLQRAEMKNVPVFYLALKSDELVGLLNGMDYNPDSPVTPKEHEIFSQLTASLRDQLVILTRQPAGKDLSPAIRNKLATFEGLLGEFEGRGV